MRSGSVTGATVDKTGRGAGSGNASIQSRLGDARELIVGEGQQNVELSPDSIMMLRTTQQHHVRLSAMADQKAGFLIGGSVVLIGLVIGNLDDDPSLGLILVGLTALVALALSIVAVIPRYVSKPSAEQEPNTLFFGVFAHMDEDEFIDHHMELSTDQDAVHRAMLRDIHQMGSSLNSKKFRYLSYAFTVALWGMVAAFAVAVIDAVVS